MKTLELHEMENVEGGDWGCGLALAGLAVSFAGLATLTAASGGLAIGIAVVGFNVASASAVNAC